MIRTGRQSFTAPSRYRHRTPAANHPAWSVGSRPAKTLRSSSTAHAVMRGACRPRSRHDRAGGSATVTAPASAMSAYGGEWRKLTAQAKTYYSATCHLCGRPIDLDLPANHADAWTLDHLYPVATHGAEVPTIDAVRPAHRGCNGRRGDTPLVIVSPRSEDW